MGGVLPNNFDNHVTRLIMMWSKPNYVDVVFVFVLGLLLTLTLTLPKIVIDKIDNCLKMPRIDLDTCQKKV